jgi:branched-chain amino acid transport system ATP-binding protein
MLRVEGIDVYYGDVQVLWGVSFEIEQGSITALVGSNGAGKSTTLKTVAGLLRPRRGAITFLGESITGLQPHEIVGRGVSLIPEGRMLFSKLTVLDNLRLGAYLTKDKKTREESLDWVFKLFPVLSERKEQIAGTLSGGEQQMLAIARGLMSKPKILMLDEPSLGLAPKLVSDIFDLIRKIGDEGVSILLVEQNVRKTLELADKAYVIENGRIALHGEGRDLLEDSRVKKAYLGV